MKISRGLYVATVPEGASPDCTGSSELADLGQFAPHPWALRITAHAAQVGPFGEAIFSALDASWWVGGCTLLSMPAVCKRRSQRLGIETVLRTCSPCQGVDANLHSGSVGPTLPQAACVMWRLRPRLKKTQGQAGWGTLYLLQRLSEEGAPEPHYKVGDHPTFMSCTYIAHGCQC